MSEKDLAHHALAAIIDSGFEKAACRVSSDELHELQAETGEINLFRTNFETEISMSGIRNERRASLSVNKTDGMTLSSAVEDLKTMAEGANADAAHDIAEAQPHEVFQAGVTSPDYDLMYDRVVEFRQYVTAQYPTLKLRSVGVSFARRKSCFVNSNDVQFESNRGSYNVSVSFSSREGTDNSSMMYSGYTRYDLSLPIQQETNMDMLLRQSTEQVHTSHIPAKFVGDLVIAPNCLSNFIGFLTMRISDGPMIAGTSVYQDKLGQQVASDRLTLRSMPCADEIISGYWVTADGYKAENCTIIDKGVLDTYLLGLYGANRTGLARAVNSGGCYVIDAGTEAYEDMIKGVKEGILITRFSGGRPNDRGDFSGVAKNSYYIRDGKLAFPIKETTVSGNMVSVLESINAVSRERLNFGGSILPWVRVSGITVS